MSLNAGKIEVIKHQIEHSFGVREGCFCHSRNKNQRGFTLVELVTVMVILGIISVIALPRMFNSSSFDSRAFSDSVRATLRLAQKTAIAQHRKVCVTVTTAAPANLTINVSSTSAETCDVPLPSLSGDGNYQARTHGKAQLTSSAAVITFDKTGSPGAANITLQVDTETQIVVSAVTGYVH
jgi:MSHA pilin protein MshC